MFIIHVDMTIKDGFAQKYCDEILNIRETVLKEKGCKMYEPYLKPDGTGAVMFEMWESDECLEAHLNQPHLKALFERTSPWMEGKPEFSKFILA